MKKFTSLILMLMLVFSGSISAQTLITSLDQLSNHHAYYLKCARGYAYSAPNHGQLVASADKDATPNGDDYKFVIYKDADNYYLYNLGAGFFCKKNGDNVGFSVDKLENVTFERVPMQPILGRFLSIQEGIKSVLIIITEVDSL